MLNTGLIDFKGVRPVLATSLFHASDVTTRFLLAAKLARFVAV